jgi:trigger factor
MESKVKKQPKSRVTLTVTASEDELKSHEAAAMQHLREQANLPGFRKGKVPDSKLREHFGVQGIRAHVIEHALPSLYADAVKEHDLKPVARPETAITTLEPLSVDFSVDVYPEVEVSKVDKIKLKAAAPAVSEEDVAAVMEDLRKRFRTFSPAERPARMEDRLELSFTGEIEGKADPRLSSQHHPVILGSNSFIPGFEEQLQGATAGATKDIAVTFPADYRFVELRGKPAIFHVTVESVEQVDLPPLDDALAVRATGKADATIAALREDIRAGILQDKGMQEDDRLERELIDALVARTKVEIPEALIVDELSYMFADLRGRIEQQGLQFDHYLEIQRTTEAGLSEKFRPEAEKRIAARLALSKIADERQITVSDEELAGALSGVEGGTNARDPRFREQMRSQLRLTKILNELRTAALA